MSIVVDKSPAARAPGEWAPPASAEIRKLLRSVHHSALPLYLELQARPDGWQPSDDQLRAELDWSASMLRKAKHALAQVGLYVWQNLRDAAGRWVRICRYLTNPDPAWVAGTASSQVSPSDPIPPAGEGSQIPPSTENKERRRSGLTRRHSMTTCERQAAGLPCSGCKAEKGMEKSSAPAIPTSHPAYRRVASVATEGPQEIQLRPEDAGLAARWRAGAAARRAEAETRRSR